MANRHKKMKMAKGGSAEPKVNEYNAQGSPEVSEAKDKSAGFKRGGKTKSAGAAEEGKSHARLDKKPRKLAAGGSPFSAAKNLSMYDSGKGSDGHQGSGPSGADKENT